MKQKSLVILFALCVMLSSCFEDKRTYMETQLPPVEQTDTSDKEKGEIDTQKTDSPEMQTDTVDREKGITDSLKTDTTKAIAKDTMKAEDVNSAKAGTKEGGLPTFWEVLSLGFSGLARVLCIVIWHQIGRFGKDVSHELRVVEQDCHRLNSKNTMMGSRFDKIEKNCSDMRNNID